jgi:hypothetical protein
MMAGVCCIWFGDIALFDGMPRTHDAHAHGANRRGGGISDRFRVQPRISARVRLSARDLAPNAATPQSHLLSLGVGCGRPYDRGRLNLKMNWSARPRIEGSKTPRIENRNS